MWAVTEPQNPSQPQPNEPGQQPYGQQPYGQQPYTPSQPGAPLSQQDEKTWAILSHVGGLLFSFVAPLIIWLVFRGRGPYLENQAKEALNFQITLLIAYIAGSILSVIGIGLLILLAAWVAALVFGILAAIAASRFEWYRYPVTLRLVK